MVNKRIVVLGVVLVSSGVLTLNASSPRAKSDLMAGAKHTNSTLQPAFALTMSTVS
jgi:hypothetical protein